MTELRARLSDAGYGPLRTSKLPRMVEIMATSSGPAVLRASAFSAAPLSLAIKWILIDRIWPSTAAQRLLQQNDEDFEVYISFFEQECRPDLSTYHAIKSYGDMMFVLDTVRGNPTATLADLRGLVGSTNAVLASDETKLSASIELVVRVWLMVNVRVLLPADRHELRTSLPWPDNQTLVSVLHRQISQPPTSQITPAGKFSFYFNVSDMANMAGFRVEWTNDLMDHLTVRGASIYLYHHVSVLKRMRGSVPT